MNVFISAAVGAALPWLFTLIWSFIYWDFRWDSNDIKRDTRASVIFAVLGVALMAVKGGAA
ncbi:hypothetical protein [Cronobacter sakazakii]|uniref:hypothetical protein n=1 Tax=Cronobacter sakazakii TaxID=28141 RepID=UPI000DFD90D7|nr:hypothetical protein [Cronobacter sakazakii]STD04924.1 Uncharacterised protein [Cronobacter sakazakii]STE70533.1 Uncharacterised protein [Cronobacter sakazakii]